MAVETEEVAARLLAEFPAALASGQIVAYTSTGTVAAWLPITASTELLGVPAEDRRKVLEWANVSTGATDPEYGGDLNGLITVMMETFAYATELQNARRAHPADAARPRHDRQLQEIIAGAGEDISGVAGDAGGAPWAR